VTGRPKNLIFASAFSSVVRKA
jgi:putative SOS response-associated peptidase YedK